MDCNYTSLVENVRRLYYVHVFTTNLLPGMYLDYRLVRAPTPMMKTAKMKKVTSPNSKHPGRRDQLLPLSTLLSLELHQAYRTYKTLVLVGSDIQ